MPQKNFEESFYPFLAKHKDYIYDIYFTSRISPFDVDAMGAFIRDTDKQILIEEINNNNNKDIINNTEKINECVNCKTFAIIKDELKLIKKESYERLKKVFDFSDFKG